MLLGPDGKPIVNEGVKVDFSLLAIPVLVAKKKVLNTSDPPEVVLSCMFAVPANKFEFYSNHQEVFTDVVVTNLLALYLQKYKNTSINDLPKRKLDKELNYFINNHEIMISPQVFPLDDIIYDLLPIEDLKEMIKGPKDDKEAFLEKTTEKGSDGGQNELA